MKRRKPRKPFNSPRATRETEVILEAMALRRWSKSLEGCLKFLNSLERVKGGQHEGWIKGNFNYYLKRVRTLVDNPPKGAKAVADKARAVLDEFEGK